jgi:hypothetical protein
MCSSEQFFQFKPRSDDELTRFDPASLWVIHDKGSEIAVLAVCCTDRAIDRLHSRV